jgi:hypothetical protein
VFSELVAFSHDREADASDEIAAQEGLRVGIGKLARDGVSSAIRLARVTRQG